MVISRMAVIGNPSFAEWLINCLIATNRPSFLDFAFEQLQMFLDLVSLSLHNLSIETFHEYDLLNPEHIYWYARCIVLPLII